MTEKMNIFLTFNLSNEKNCDHTKLIFLKFSFSYTDFYFETKILAFQNFRSDVPMKCDVNFFFIKFNIGSISWLLLCWKGLTTVNYI